MVQIDTQNIILSSEQINFYKKYNFIKIKDVLSKEELSHWNKLISEYIDNANIQNEALENRDTYGKAFLQIFNLWCESEDIKALVFSKKIANLAAQLMEVDAVRIYHDQALFKEAGGGITPWHADQYYWPLSSDKTVTAWIPLQETPLEMGPLEFSAGSQAIVEGRELAIGDESEAKIQEKLRVTDFKHVIEPYALGEISFHSGWIFHRAGANNTNETRKVMTVIYMDSEMKLKNPSNQNQINDWHKWCPGAEIDKIINTNYNPII